MDNQVFYVVVVPTLVTGAAFIGITTLGDDSNFVDTLMNIKRPDGKPLMNSIRIDMVCDECKREGLELTCQHKNGDIPHWQSQGRAADIEMMMVGQENTYLLETKGMRGNGEYAKFFDSKDLKVMSSERKTYIPKGDPFVDNIYITIDPSAGGKHSNYAIISCIYNEEKTIITGGESGERLDAEQIIAMIVNHIAALREIRHLKNSRAIIIPECNLGNEASWIASGLKRVKKLLNWEIVHEDINKRVGFRTTNETKCNMAYGFADRLRAQTIYFHQNFVCNGNGKKSTEKTLASGMKLEIMNQLTNYSRSVTSPKNGSGKSYEIFTGKVDMGCDDHAIALQMNCYVQNELSRTTRRFIR